MSRESTIGAGVLAEPLPSVVVGYGRAGRDLHHTALRSLYGDAHPVIAVDPAAVTRPSGARLAAGVVDALTLLRESGVDPEGAVFHVTTPPAAHLACTEELVRHGARNIILEKPIASSARESRRLGELGDRARILPVSVWPHSRVTEHVRRLLADGRIGRPVALHMEQSKPRFARTVASLAHGSAFEVELPHQVLLALHLAGPDARVLAAYSWAMPLPDRSVPMMGGALVHLLHAGGVVSTLLSDLTAPVRRRRLYVTGTGGEVFADYPVSSEDPYGQVRVAGRPGRTVIEDAPLTQFLRSAYTHFGGWAGPPVADHSLHHRSIELLEEARRMAVDLHPTERESLPW